MEAFESLKKRLNFDRRHRILLGVVPMILTPRWFFVNVQKELEKACGRKVAKEVYYRAGFESAYKFCKTLRQSEGLDGSDTVGVYLDSMSLRGWGKFRIVRLDVGGGIGLFRLERSAFADEYGSVGQTVCHCWPGAMAGALQEVIDAYSLDRVVRGREVRCRGKGEPFCEFLVQPLGQKRREKGGKHAHCRGED
jgi:predicted hydrocarbon binding protein